MEELGRRLPRLPLSEEEKGSIYGSIIHLPEEELLKLFPVFLSDEAVAASLKRLVLRDVEGRKRALSTRYVTAAMDPSSKRQKVIDRYKPVYVDPHTMVGSPDPVLVALRWLYLLVEEGKVLVTNIRHTRLCEIEVAERDYYPAIRCFLRAASFGQEGLHFGGEGQGNSQKSDVQGFVKNKLKSPTEVKTKVKGATDRDTTGVGSNALLIGQEAECLESTEGPEPVAIGCLFCRMDRFWLVKYLRHDGSVQVTPDFPRAQKPNETPEQLVLMNPAFVLMNMRDLDDSQSRLKSARLWDILPHTPSAGFETLVAYVEQLRVIHGLPVSAVRFRGAHGDVGISDLKIVAYGHKSLAMLRISCWTVLKICLPAPAEHEKEIYTTSDGHPNLRQLLNWGSVDIGNRLAAFQFLELESFGEPFSAKHIPDLASTEMMWNQAFEGLRHLHGKGILHRDVKPGNMLVFKGNVLKINDYDISCFKTDRQALRRRVGTRGYHSPSSMQPYKEEDDILSLALAFYSAKLNMTRSSTRGRLRILRRCLDARMFPACMRTAVEDALRKLGLDQEQDNEDDEENRGEDDDDDDENEEDEDEDEDDSDENEENEDEE